MAQIYIYVSPFTTYGHGYGYAISTHKDQQNLTYTSNMKNSYTIYYTN
jgi:hypothetical protein